MDVKLCATGQGTVIFSTLLSLSLFAQRFLWVTGTDLLKAPPIMLDCCLTFFPFYWPHSEAPFKYCLTELHRRVPLGKRKLALSRNSPPLWNLTVYIIPSLVPFLYHFNPIHTLTWYFFNTSCIQAWPSNMVSIGCRETSVTNYQSTLCNNPEEWRSHLHRCRGL